MDRRRFLGLLPAMLAVSAPSYLSPLHAARPRPPGSKAALLLPLTGPSASLGVSMQRAAALVQPVVGRDAGLMLVDTGGTADGAAVAATLALKRGAMMILGPLLSAEVRPVVAAVAGRIPVLTFSNDEALRDSGAFLLGITATQVTSAVLRYAHRRGVRTAAMLVGATPWSIQVAAAAARLQGEVGIAITPVQSADPAVLQGAAGADLPDALLVADGGDGFATAARLTKGSGMQLLGTVQALDAGPSMPLGAEGAWIAAPDPSAFDEFAQTYEQRNGGAPGTIAALGYDGATIVRSLQAGGRLDREGLIQTASFPGVTGAVHFREDGTATRQLAILVADATGYAPVPA